MFDIILCKKSSDCILRFWLINYSDLMGAITLYPSKMSKKKAILDIFIEEKYRKKWLAKNFAKKISDIIILNAKEKNINEIISKAIAPQSYRLLDFFGFEVYNKNYYKLII